MGDLISQWIVPAVFGLVSVPIVRWDLKDLEIPVFWFLVLFAVLLPAAYWHSPGAWPGRVLGAGMVLVAGMLALWAVPGRLGEGDVLYLAAFPLVLGFFPFLFAVGLACAGAMAFFSWSALIQKKWDDRPLAFIPFLFWGCLAQLLLEGSIP